jgi:hypothetical protein
MPERERMLQRRIRVANLAIGAKGIAKAQVARPVQAGSFHQVQMVAARLASTKKLPARQAAVSAVCVTEGFEGDDVGRRDRTQTVPGGDVKDRLGGKAGDGSAADVLQRERGQSSSRDRVSNSCSLGLEERRPAIVVRNDPHRFRFQS